MVEVIYFWKKKCLWFINFLKKIYFCRWLPPEQKMDVGVMGCHNSLSVMIIVLSLNGTP